LPGADELFRRTSDRPSERKRDKQESKSTKLQVASEAAQTETVPAKEPKAPKHEEKVTFYCTPSDLMDLEQARLKLRGDYSVAADRGRIVRAALAYVLEDFEARGDDSVLVRSLSD
jgi:hypothetical protein